MRPFIRLLLWILIAALPLQGWAADMIPCHAQTMTVVQAAQAEHCAPAKPHKAAGTQTKCSHCASCVGASAPPGVPVIDLPAAFSGAGFSAAEPAMTAYIPATLERPPRLS